MRDKWHRMRNAILKEEKFQGLSVSEFKTDYKFILVEGWGNRSKGPNRELRNRPIETESLSSLYTKTEEEKKSNWVMWDFSFYDVNMF